MNSYWISSTKKFIPKTKLNKNHSADVCIIGAGICGLSTAYYLAKIGLNVVLLDKSEIGEKVSGYTTAKITSQHGLIYNYLIESYGLEFALNYFSSNEIAISNIKSIVNKECIDCEFEMQDNYVYSCNSTDLAKIHAEINALDTIHEHIKNSSLENIQASANNISNISNILSKDKFATFVKQCSLTFNISGAVKVSNQAQFHPLKYLNGLAYCIEKSGNIIFTNCLVEGVKKVKHGYIVQVNSLSNSNYCNINCKYVVLASHYPFISIPGFYFSKMYQTTSYAMALDVGKNVFDVMFITASEPIVSFRSVNYNNRKLLIIGGGNHKTGFSPENDSNYGYSFLEKTAKNIFGDFKILYKWNTRDCVTLDKIPYIGSFASFMPNIYIATGFNKWGMTTSNVSANIIAVKIIEQENKDNHISKISETPYTTALINFSNNYSKIFDSTRFNPIKNRAEVKNMTTQVVHSFVESRLKIPKEDLDKIKNDNGCILKIDGTIVGIYKDKNGKIYAVNPKCTHLGCLLTWNNIDKTWDCPSHGSRFDYTGKNLYF